MSFFAGLSVEKSYQAKIAPYLILFLGVLIAYGNVYHNTFIFDDVNLLIKNSFLRQWSSLPQIFETTIMAGAGISSNYYRPLQIITYLLVYKVAGLSIVAFHFLNVALHGLNACMVFRLGKKLNFDIRGVFSAALLWALHPIHVEAVTYLSATADPLFAFFCLLGVIILLPDFTPWRIVAALLCMALALLSKETALVFPLLAASCRYLLAKNRFDYRVYFCLWPFVLLAGTYAALHFTLPFGGMVSLDAIPSQDEGSSSNYALFTSLPFYAKMLLWPVGFYMERTIPDYSSLFHIEPVAGLVFVILASLLILRNTSSNLLPFAWGLLWFVAAHSLLSVASSIIYEHWMYLPSIGLFLGTAQTIILIFPKAIQSNFKLSYPLGFLTVAILLGVLTFYQNTRWIDLEIFAKNILYHEPNSPKAHVMLGDVYLAQKDYLRAAEEYRLSIVDSKDTLSVAQNNLGVALENIPQDSNSETEVVEHFKRALDIDPNSYNTLLNLENYYHEHGDLNTANYYGQRVKDAQKHFMIRNSLKE